MAQTESIGSRPQTRLDLPPAPMSKSQITKLGRRMRKEEPTAALRQEYAAVLEWYDQAAEILKEDVNRFLSDRFPKLKLVVTSRAKRYETTRDKLIREGTIQLPNIVDLAGLRVRGPMTLRQQDQVSDALIERLSQAPSCKVDLRDGGHAGYRAIHLRITIPGSFALAEVQIRTQLQNAWANAYEELAELVGRAIRYGEPLEEADSEVEGLAAELREWSREIVAEGEQLQVDLANNVVRLKSMEKATFRSGNLRAYWIGSKALAHRLTQSVPAHRRVRRMNQRVLDRLEGLGKTITERRGQD